MPLKPFHFPGLLSLLYFFSCHLYAQDFALEQLANSPRHQEWVNIPLGDRTLKAFLVFPEVAEKAQTVIIIHENRGLTDWVRSFADQMASAGYIALAPDLLSGFRDDISSTQDFGTSDEARSAIYQLNPDQITQDLNKAFQYLKNLDAGNGQVAVIGFCWGGSQSFRYATNNPDLLSALVFYGTGPEDPSAYRHIECPVYGFYGENDQRVNATIEKSAAAMKKWGKTYQYEIYKGAGHAYMRNGDDPSGNHDNKKARNDSFQRIKKLFE